MHQATLEIVEAFEKHDLKYETREIDHISYVEAGFSGDNIKGVRVRFLSSDEDNDVAVRAFRFVSVTADKREKLLPVLNELNRVYRFTKFVMDEDGDVSVEYDLPEKGDNVGEVCFEILIRFVKILDDCYPKLMKALWG